MNRQEFLSAVDLDQPLLAVQGDIFETPADHIAFAVNFDGENCESANTGGFAGEVAKRYWPELATYKFEAGVPVHYYSTLIGKNFYALPVHTNEEGGWDNAPHFITQCLDALPVPSTEVIATVLIGGGKAGAKYRASPRNIEAMAMSYKEIILYVYKESEYHTLVQLGLLASPRRATTFFQPKLLGGVKVVVDFSLNDQKVLERVGADQNV